MRIKKIVKNFWVDNKHVFEILGGIFVVGALFLSINLPKNAAGLSELRFVQLGWLCLVAVALVTFLAQLIIFADQVEKENNNVGPAFNGIITLPVISASAMIAYFLCRFIIVSYRDEWADIIHSHWFVVIAILFVNKLRTVVLWKIKNSKISASGIACTKVVSLCIASVIQLIVLCLLESVVQFQSSLSNGKIFLLATMLIVLVATNVIMDWLRKKFDDVSERFSEVEGLIFFVVFSAYFLYLIGFLWALSLALKAISSFL